MVALDAQAQGVPVPFLQDFLFLIRYLDQPATTIGFIDAAGVMALGSNFTLPSVDMVVPLDERVEEQAGIAVGDLLELDRQIEVLLVLPCP